MSSPSQSLLPSHRQQQPTLSQQVPQKLRDYFSGAVDGGEPQQLGHTRRQTARNKKGIGNRPQNAGDGVAQQLGPTRRYAARNQGVMQHGLLFLMALMAAWESIRHVLYHPASPHANAPLPTRPVSQLFTPSSYSEALTDKYSHLRVQVMKK